MIGTDLTDVVHQEDKKDVPQLLNGSINDRFILRMADYLSPHLKNPQKIQYKVWLTQQKIKGPGDWTTVCVISTILSIVAASSGLRDHNTLYTTL